MERVVIPVLWDGENDELCHFSSVLPCIVYVLS